MLVDSLSQKRVFVGADETLEVMEEVFPSSFEHPSMRDLPKKHCSTTAAEKRGGAFCWGLVCVAQDG